MASVPALVVPAIPIPETHVHYCHSKTLCPGCGVRYIYLDSTSCQICKHRRRESVRESGSNG